MLLQALATSKIPGVVAFKDVRSTIKKHKTKRYGRRSLSQIKNIIIHHSATLTGTAEAFANYHVDTLGWPGVGYTFVVERDGLVKWTNDLESIAYHVGNSNTASIGVNMVGDFSKQDPTAEQWKSMYAVVDYLQKELPNVKSVQSIRGHQEMPGYSWKPCPSLDMDSLRGMVQSGVKKAVTTKFSNDQVIEVKLPSGQTATKVPNGFSKPNPDYYVIQPGDTLWEISHNNDGVSLEELMKLNPGVNPTNLQVGQRIRMKAEKKATATTTTTAAKKYPLPDGVLTSKSTDKKAAIKQLQNALNALTFKCGIADGVYGKNTIDAVTRFQSMYCNPADGKYGPLTKKAMEKQLAKL